VKGCLGACAILQVNLVDRMRSRLGRKRCKTFSWNYSLLRFCLR
jgi:hypothetical protein